MLQYAPQTVSSQSHAGKVARVIALDPNPLELESLDRLLSRMGYVVKTFQEPKALLEWISRQVNTLLDLIIVDLKTPEIDGLQMIRMLGERGYRGGMAMMTDGDRRLAHTTKTFAGAFDIRMYGNLMKPLSLEQVVHVLQNVTVYGPTPASDPRTYSAERLRQGIIAGELVNYYQPKIEAGTGRFVGVEALVRWKHASDGMQYPDQFIPLAEENNIIDLLTESVLNRALHDAVRWDALGLPLTMAVNVSMDNLNDVHFPDRLLSKFKTTGFPLNRFSLEITESRLMSNPKKAMEVLGRLLMHNVELSIDDFGTGHSSLKMLREVPFGELKLPNIFVHKAHEDPTLQAIFQTSVQLGKQLRMKTVAEGVETIEDLKCAMESGCDLIQGYLIAKPMKASRIPSWAYEWNKRNQPVKEYPDWSDSVFCDTAGLEYPN